MDLNVKHLEDDTGENKNLCDPGLGEEFSDVTP